MSSSLIRLLVLGVAAAAALTPGAGAAVLLGNLQVEQKLEQGEGGSALAYRTVASSSGTVAKIVVYVDQQSDATALTAGLYADVGGRPGPLLVQGTTRPLARGAWNEVAVEATDVSAGTPYWVAVIAPSGSGRLLIRNRGSSGGGAALRSAERSLTALPESWTTGNTFKDGPFSAYALEGPALAVSPSSLSFAGEVGGPSPPAQQLSIANGGDGLLDWTAASDAAWLSIFPASGIGPAAPAVSVSLSGLPPGTYTGTITVSAAGARGSPQRIPVTVTVSPRAARDVQPPTVTLTEPAAGAAVSGTVAVSAQAVDDTGVAGVQLSVDGAALGPEQTAAPYSASWDTRAALDGPHTITAVARDDAGNQAAATVTVTVDNTPPTAVMGDPGANLRGTVTLTSTATDAGSGVAAVAYERSPAGLGAWTRTSAEWDTTAVADGLYDFRAIVTDAAGNSTTTEPVTSRRVDNTAPAVAVTAPAAGATVSAAVTVRADASDEAGVVGVQFRLDGADLGSEDTAAPYEVPWDTATASDGAHTLTAVARDAAGNRATAAAVSVTVDNVADAGGLVAAFGFEEGAGTAVSDASGAGNHGTISGAGWTTAGRFGSALEFDGVDDWVTVPDSASLDLTGRMTLEAWVRPTELTAWRTALIKEQPVQLVYALYANTDTNVPSGHVFVGQDMDTRGAAMLPLGAWSHLAATYDGTVLRLFVDGSLVSSRIVPGAMSPSAEPLRIGGNRVWGEFFAGAIDEVRVYDRALTEAEIRADMTAAIGAGAPPPPPPPAPGPEQVGKWEGPFAWPGVAVHASLLPNGKVVVIDGFDSALGTERVWDPATNTFSDVPSGLNLFCSGHITLPDGRVMVVGGHVSPYVGLPSAMAFDASAGNWTRLADMARSRWYPTATALGDGRVLVVSGDNVTQGDTTKPTYLVDSSNTLPEVYEPAANRWTQLTGSQLVMPLYPFMFQLPNGLVLQAGPDPQTRTLDVRTGAWSPVGRSPIDGSSAVMYRPGKVLESGRFSEPSLSPYATDGRAAVIDMTMPAPAWREITPMAFPRGYHTLTALPDGSVLATGGSRRSDGIDAGFAVHEAELWNPAGETWTTMAAMTVPRLYHSTALLLPDGRVLVAGGGRLPGSSIVDQTSAEIYSPPYLFKGPRPTISSAPASVAYGGSFAVATSDAARIASVAVVRTGSVTHAFDQNQRYVDLSFQAGPDGVTVQAPSDGNVAPPGVYMLFLVDANGVPSVASFVRVAAAPDTTAPDVTLTAPAADTTVSGTITLSADASDNAGVAGVQFRVDGADVDAADTTAPYAVSWSTAAAADGPHTLTAVARDAAGNTTVSAPVTVTVSNAAPAALSNGLVAAYGFDEGSGLTLRDASGLGNNGTVSGATWSAAGRFSGALSFDGVDDWVTVADAPSLDLSTGMTIEAWVQPSVLRDWTNVLMKERPAGGSYGLYSRSDALNSFQPVGYMFTGSHFMTRGGLAFPSGGWRHLAATYDGTTLALYVNSTRVDMSSPSGSIVASDAPLRIGGNAPFGEFLAGLVDDVRIYNRALTGSEIFADMNTPVG